ncbi:MAG: MetQ/NlpA family ABC transporter substrate-binding protein [Alphaproteobacteria bacterium]
MKKRLLIYAIIAFMTVFVYYKNKSAKDVSFYVGVTAGPHAEIMAKVKEIADKEGLPLTVVEFNDFILPNQALDQGELTANSYQHQTFLDEQVKNRGLKIVSVGKTIILPLGAYSKKIKSSDELAKGDLVAIPNDPTNGGRALLLMDRQHIIELKKGVTNPSLMDITSNPKKLKIIEVEAPQLPRTLDDAVMCIINTDWVLLAGIDPHSALFKEDSNSPYANVLVIREADKESPRVQKLLSIYHSDAIKEFINKTFKGAVVPAW